MTYSFCQTSCSEYPDMSMLQKYAAYTAVRAKTHVQTLVIRAFIFVRPFLLPLEHDWSPNFTQEVKSSLPPEENTQ